MRPLSRFIFFLTGWKVAGRRPDLKKYILVLAPHTSNWDFFVGLFAREIVDFDPKFLAKKSLFRFPFGFIFKVLGGHPVDRSKRTKLVDQVVEIFNEKDEFIMTVTPEGTRSRVEEWKTGFYHIARGANVPIVLVSIDYGSKTVRLDEPHYADPDKEKEMKRIYGFYKGVKAKNQEKFYLPLR